jgi:hypothetical protein
MARRGEKDPDEIEAGYYAGGLTGSERRDLKKALQHDLEPEIVMLRTAMRRVYESIAGEEDLTELRLALGALGLAAVRLARLVLAQKDLALGGDTAMEILQEALRRATQDLGLEDIHGRK